MILEIALAVYCFIGVISSLYYLEIAAVPFQLLFTAGYGFVAYLSVQQAMEARRARNEKIKLHPEAVAA